MIPNIQYVSKTITGTHEMNREDGEEMIIYANADNVHTSPSVKTGANIDQHRNNIQHLQNVTFV